MKYRSLRTRLLMYLLLPVAAAYGVIGIASYYSSFHEAEEIYDAQLVHFAKVLYALTSKDLEQHELETSRVINNELFSMHEYEKNFAYRVWLKGRLVLYSGNAKAFGPMAVEGGFVERYIANERWRFFILHNGEIDVEVAEKYEVRIDLIHHILEGIFLPQLLIIPSLALILWLGVVGGLRPLTLLSGLIRGRSPHNLEPINAPFVPRELAPVIESINDLMQRVDDVIEREKQFSNYAAHELRTPLAALKTQLQVALRSDDPAEAQAMYEDLLPAIDRMQHMVEQLLMLVRVKAAQNDRVPIDLGAVCRDALKELAPVALASQRHLDTDISSGSMIAGNAEMLSVMIRNLVNNALKYTLDDGKVLVSVDRVGDRVTLSVADDGIGIGDRDREQIFECFYRAHGTGVEGCGIGLAIVKWIVDTHSADISLATGLDNRGSSFSISFKALPLPAGE